MRAAAVPPGPIRRLRADLITGWEEAAPSCPRDRGDPWLASQLSRRHPFPDGGERRLSLHSSPLHPRRPYSRGPRELPQSNTCRSSEFPRTLPGAPTEGPPPRSAVLLAVDKGAWLPLRRLARVQIQKYKVHSRGKVLSSHYTHKLSV